MMLVSDIHIKEMYSDKYYDAMDFLTAAVNKIMPDLVIFMGDIAIHYDAKREDGSREPIDEDGLRLKIQSIFKPIADLDIPVALVLGNHDLGPIVSREEGFRLYQEYPKCLAQAGPDEISGCGNYNLFIKDSKGEKDVFNLWFMDTGRYPEEGKKGKYSCVRKDQIEWYEKTQTEIKENNGGKSIPAILFQHIPVPEIYRLLRKTSKYNPFRIGGFGIFSENSYMIANKRKIKGQLGQGPSCADYDNRQFESWKNQGDLLAAFFGHDHMNDFWGEVDGIILGQCKTAGFHVYGDGLGQKVRVITLDENDLTKFETKMCSYRKLIGWKSRSVKGYETLPDLLRRDIKNFLPPMAILAGVGIVIKVIAWIIKFYI